MLFWVIIPYSLEKTRHFGATYRLHLQGQRVSKLSMLPTSAGSLLALLFNPEDAGDMFLRNVPLSSHYMA
jgi:hypothetical protein